MTSLDMLLLSGDTVYTQWIIEFHVTSEILHLSLLPIFPTFNLKKKKLTLVAQANYLLIS